METTNKKILHIFTDSDFNEKLNKECRANGYGFESETDPIKVFENLSYHIMVILVSGKLLRKELPAFFKLFKDSRFDQIPIIAIISEEEEYYKKAIFNLGFSDYISSKLTVTKIMEYVIAFSQKEQVAKERLQYISIAIIDDERLHATAIQMGIDCRGLSNITIYESAEAFLESPSEYDIYLVDIILKDVSGIKLIQTLRKTYKKSLIIAVSSLRDDKIGPIAIEKGADYFIRKPMNYALLFNKIMAWLK
jgi:DNA-binding response OmpR family regulator